MISGREARNVGLEETESGPACLPTASWWCASCLRELARASRRDQRRRVWGPRVPRGHDWCRRTAWLVPAAC